MKINDLQNFRYSITDLRNEGKSSSSWCSNGVGLVRIQMPFSYQFLVASHIDQLRQQGASEQVIRNHRTALNGWLDTQHKLESSFVGDELREEQFASELQRHLDNSGLGTRSLSDRRSLLRSWQNTFLSLDQATPSIGRQRLRGEPVPEVLNPFERVLREALARKKILPKRAALLCEISPSALSRWTRGALPNARSTVSLSKLDDLLELEPGTLERALSESQQREQPVHAIPFRDRLRSAKETRVGLKYKDISAHLLSEWKDFVHYKTCMRPANLIRRPSAKWSLTDPLDSLLKANKITQVGTQVCQSAEIAWNHISGFLGYLSLPSLSGSVVKEGDFSETLAWLVVPEAQEAFMAFKTSRSGGLTHRGHKGLAGLIAALTHEKHGYLRQQPTLLELLPDAATRGRTWEELCTKSHELAKLYHSSAQDKSRNPADAVQFFLEQSNPVQPFHDAMDTLECIANSAPTDSREQLIAQRDRLLLGLLVANPLRAKHWATLGITPGSSGDIHRTADGGWRIRIPGRQFKNRTRIGSETYSVAIPARLSQMIDDYVKHIRPRLLGSAQDNGRFFLSYGGKRFSGISRRVRQLTKRLMPGCGGIGPHAVRHIVATDWLTHHPDDYLTVAELLNDSLSVVIHEYAHLKKDSAFSRYESHVNDRKK